MSFKPWQQSEKTLISLISPSYLELNNLMVHTYYTHTFLTLATVLCVYLLIPFKSKWCCALMETKERKKGRLKPAQLKRVIKIDWKLIHMKYLHVKTHVIFYGLLPAAFCIVETWMGWGNISAFAVFEAHRWWTHCGQYIQEEETYWAQLFTLKKGDHPICTISQHVHLYCFATGSLFKKIFSKKKHINECS